ncbi:hypothetical protein LXA43DRAFT_1077921 [Ganoderma leucocontextum]|nr:hypothetical protein LXA43DRAFT_1077921 [Ganoderma leucocontextum]
MSTRYNFRPRRSGVEPAAAQPLVQGEQPEISTATDAIPPSPLTEDSDVQSPTGSESSKTQPPGLGSRPPSEGPETASADALVAPSPPPTMPGALTSVRKHPVTVEDATDDDDDRGGPWLSVQRRPSTGQAPAAAQGGPVLTTPQREAVNSAAENLTAAEKELGPRRPRSPSPGSRGGKTVDARNWGASGIPDEDLDPEAQRRELDLYSNRNSNLFDEYDTEEQRAILDYWQAQKEERESEHEPSAVSTPRARPDTPSEPKERSIARTSARSRVSDQQSELAQLRDVAEKRRTAHKKKKAARKERERSVTGKSAGSGKTAGNTHRASSLRPVAQLEPGSYFSSSSSSASDSSSTAGGAPDGGSSSGGSSSSSESSDGRKSAKKRKKSRKSKKKKKKPVLKPEKPEKYNGNANAQDFHKFMRQMVEYIRGHTVAPSMFASTVREASASTYMSSKTSSCWSGLCPNVSASTGCGMV